MITCCRCQPLPIGAEAHVDDPAANTNDARVSLQGQEVLAGSCIPHLHGVVSARRCQPLSVRTEGHISDPTFMSRESHEVLAGVRVPQHYLAWAGEVVDCGGQTLSVGAETRAVNGMSFDGHEILAGPRFPHPHREVAACRCQP